MTTESERWTRKSRIDPRVKRAGWATITESTPEVDVAALAATALEEYPTDDGPADYALCHGGRILGVAEAKRVTRGPSGVLTQAARYSRGIDQSPLYQDGHGVPFLYSTNGEVIWFHDIRDPLNVSRTVAEFHTPAALMELLNRDTSAEFARLAALSHHSSMRPYQIEAAAAIEAALRKRQRKMLVAMATGTGKTRTMVNEIYRLMKSGVARRVLFLVDRRALAAQAVTAFNSFEAEPGLKFNNIYPVFSQRFQQGDYDDGEQYDPNVMPNSLLTDPKPGDAFVYVSTIQRMTINLFGGEHNPFRNEEELEPDAEKLDIPIHAFDLIVADECHRGYSGKELSIWSRTLDHFDAVKIGLTATPAAHTYTFFDQNIVFNYEYGRAVREGFLVDYDQVNIRSNVRMNGVFLEEGEQVDEIDPQTGVRRIDYLEDERAYDASKVEREITAPDSNRKILEEIKRHADEHLERTGRFPKTLIFSVGDEAHTSHADQLVETAREVFGQGESFVAKITGKVDRPLQRIREFRNRAKPVIVVTVDLLTTGVDIPDLEFLVFLRPVQSRILFEQMMGRGTRLGGDRAPDKANFVVFDCFDGTLFEYFHRATGMMVEPPEGDNKSTKLIIEEIWQNKDRAYNTKRLIKRLQRIDKQMSGDARDLFAAYIPDGDVGGFAAQLAGLLSQSFTTTMKTLRDPKFQELLEKYPRAQRTFLVAPGVSDDVSSVRLIKDGTGVEYQPEDYLAAFARFVRKKGGEIEALDVLLTKPTGWGAEPLKQLRQALIRAPEHFTEEKLRLAYRQSKLRDTADIISMIKRAASEASPLLTAEERVNLAVTRATAALNLSPEQTKWLDHIRQHLIANLSIEPNDFEAVPVLADRGGWGPANRAFGGKLTILIQDLNRELVAA